MQTNKDEIIRDINLIYKIMQTKAFSAYADNLNQADAHKYTRSIIRDDLPKILSIDDKYNLSTKEISLKDVEKKSIDFISELEKNSGDKTYLTKCIKNIKLTFSKINNSIDVETQVNVIELVSRAWDLATKLGVNEQGMVISIFNDNIADGGGCLAGLVARLYIPYINFVRDALNSKLDQNLTFKPNINFMT